jgi:dTMP kinase
LITFEGPEGSGKSTQIELVASYLSQLGYDILCTREPGGTTIGDKIRQIVLDAKHTEMSLATEILLYSASRAQLVEQVILPHLERGGVVLCDRYIDSFYAYQGYGRQLDLAVLQFITRFATQGLQPDLTIYLDVSVEQGLKRKVSASREGQGEWNRLDQLDLAFHHRVRAGYQSMAQAEPERWLVVDASTSIEATNQIIRRRLGQLLAGKQRGM